MIHDFSKVHLYIQTWLHAMLAEHDQHSDFIEKSLCDFYNVIPGRFLPLTNVKDFAYLVETEEAIFLSVSGTKNVRGWVDDARIIPIRGFHAGFRDSFYDMIADPLVKFIGNSKKPVKCTGHSRGVISQYAGFYLRDEVQHPNVEVVTFCGPHLTNKKGFDRCKDAKLRNTRIWIDKGDVVDDVGILWGKHYGYSVRLPYCGRPGVVENQFIDGILMGHAPSYVTKCLKQLFVDWKKPEQCQILSLIEQFAVR
jgi:hypothetical protein